MCAGHKAGHGGQDQGRHQGGGGGRGGDELRDLAPPRGEDQRQVRARRVRVPVVLELHDLQAVEEHLQHGRHRGHPVHGQAAGGLQASISPTITVRLRAPGDDKN